MKPEFKVGDLVKVGIDEDGYFTPWNSRAERRFCPCVVDAAEGPGMVNRIAVKIDNEIKLFASDYFKKVGKEERVLLKMVE
jgi:hypothetical protein